METREVYVEGYIFRNEENGYSVLDTSENGSPLTVVGIFETDVTGEVLRVTGETVLHPSYGPQLKSASYEIVRPTDAEGIRRYLASGAIKGIGEKMAARIVAAFGDDSLRIMEEEPERLAEIKGISLRKAQELGVIVEEKKDVRAGLMYLQQFGISNKLAIKIFERYQNAVYQLVREDPYRLIEDIEGIGFVTADRIAEAMGIGKDSVERIRAGIYYVLQTNLAEGNTCLPADVMVTRAAATLEVEEEAVKSVLSDLLIKGDMIRRGEMVFHRQAYFAEIKTAKLLLDHNWHLPQNEDRTLEEIKRIEERGGYELDPLQREAVLKSVSNGLLLLTGGPGTGKTTTINTMIELFLSRGLSLALAAPTGRAAKRMSEATGYQAKTLHRLLEVKAVDGGRSIFERNEDNPLDADVVIVDEMSMVDIFLFQALMKALDGRTHLILVGDPDQLPSVGPGRVLSDIQQSDRFESICLEKIFRQEEGSDIVLSAHQIQKGRMIRLDNKSEDFFFLERDDVGLITRNILTLVLKQLPGHFRISPDQVQVLTPVKKGALGVESLNELLQNYINPASPDKREYQMGDKILREGDKVMQTRNDYEMVWEIRGFSGIVIDRGEGVFNGDLGIITSIDTISRRILVKTDDDKEVAYTYEQAEDLELAYAMTIHKSQGSEYPAVVIPLLGVPRQMEYRNLLYTAVSRARKCVTIIGSRQVVEDMIAGENRQLRYTGLRDQLTELGEIFDKKAD
ncbi:MAG: ATP-dependent RecD-like DNA helicase [Lachnospiraceae bacterium]|nr:ATP-dependent RecD-like DNA helicase [Lachnospiraceae bacterium]